MTGVNELLHPQSHPRRAVFPGSFDPYTSGHHDLVSRAAAFVDELIIAVGVNHAKSPIFTAKERQEMIRRATADLPHVRVEVMETTLVDFCAQQGSGLVVKGVRDSADMASEATQAAINRDLGGIDTILLPTRPELSHISSSIVRELMRWGIDPSRYVPREVAAFIRDNRKGIGAGHQAMGIHQGRTP